MKMHGAYVRLVDGREGFVVASGLDGLTIHTTEGRVAHAAASTVTAIPTPVAPDPPQPQRSTQRPIQTSHETPPVQRIANPLNMPVLVSGKWSDPQ
jgi:hypothetical protein